MQLPDTGVVDVAIATPLSTNGRFIVDAHGKRVRLAGVNWYGASEDLGVPVGLDTVHRNLLAQLIAGLEFNSVRFPFSVWMTEQTAPVPDQYLAANPDLQGATPLQVYDACVESLTGAGLMVIPNCHLMDFGWCCADQDFNGLWFNDRWTEAKFTATWQEMVKRYASNPLVVGMDVKNEPRDATVGGHVLSPTWGPGDQTDFAAMYTTIGNVIHELNPHVLVICEGLGYATDLQGVTSHPVKLAQANKVVYSMHDYSWFHPQGQPAAAYAEAMNKAGGYILSEKIAPLWIGEFGDTVSSLAAAGSGSWWANIRAWLTSNDIDWCWWALNPLHGQSSDPGTTTVKYNWGQPEPYGLLDPDWANVVSPEVMTMLQAMVAPRTGPGVS
jgi:endoglucanase